MRLARFTVYRPVFTVMMVLIVMILGGISLMRLPIDLMPDITYPTLSVTTEYENASPEEVEELITRVIEEAMSAVPGVEEVTSSSLEGRSVVRVSFTWGTDLDVASNDVRDRLDRITARLPDEAERPILRRFDLASFPILILGASSHLDPVQMRRVIDDEIKYRIERLPGVASLDVQGGLEREIHVSLSGDKIKALGLSLDQVMAKIRAFNVTIPAGSREVGNLEVMVRTPGQFTNLDELRNTVIAVQEGVPVRLSEIAAVEDAWQKVTRIVRVNGKPGVRMAVMKQSGTNTVEVAEGVLDELEKINREFPQIHVTPIIDTSDYIKRSIDNVGSSVLYGGALAIFVLLLFLRTIRSTAVIATAIPISVIATFALMYFGGFTLNLMSLGGLALGVGMLVDNAIVVLENIYRFREGGVPPVQAAVEGTEEVTAAIVASTFTTLVVFLPLIFVRGMSGVMFKQLSYVVSFALACSLASALTLVPTLASLILRKVGPDAPAQSGWSQRMFERTGRYLKSMEEAYKAILRYALDHKRVVLFGGVALFAGSLFLIPLVGVEFMPEADEGEVRIAVEMQVGTRVEIVEKTFEAIQKIVEQQVPEINNTIAFMGGSMWGGASHRGEMRISLKPESQRSRSSEDIAADLRRKLAHIPGAVIRTRAGQGLWILRMGRTTVEKVTVEIRGHDLRVAEGLAQQVKTLVEQVEGVTDVQVSRESGTPEELVVVDRQKIADMKLTVSQIADMLQTVLSGTEAGYYREAGNEYRILVKLKDAERMDIREILDLTVTNAEGKPVVLRNVVRVQPRTGPVLIERKDQERIITVSANIAARDLGSILKDTGKKLSTIPTPKDFIISFGGDYEEQQKAYNELLLSFALSLILIYMVMASLYESLLDPFIVMFSVPLAAIGVILMLFFTHTTFNVQAFIGCIMLGGIVVNNAILLVDHSNLLYQERGMALKEAIMEAGRRRLRPILMTALTTILALLPLALGLGEGAETQAPMARTVMGGLLSSTLITLVFVPVVYFVFKTKLVGKREVVAGAAQESAGIEVKASS
jgi:HAE1 family hydrophobic/amphiphilic exporter-1